MIRIRWVALPKSVRDNLDNATRHFKVDIKTWLCNFNEVLDPFNATFDNMDFAIDFENEAMYTWFILRWS